MIRSGFSLVWLGFIWPGLFLCLKKLTEKIPAGKNTRGKDLEEERPIGENTGGEKT